MSQRTFLFSLQSIDSQIDKITERIKAIDYKINASAEISASQRQITQTETKLADKNKEIAEVERQSGVLSNKLWQSEKDLYDGKIKNPKELQSVQEEGVSLRKRIQAFEDKLMDLMLEYETIENDLHQQTETHKTLLEKKGAENQTLSDEKRMLQETLEKIKTEKEPIANQIKPELMRKYQELRETRNKLAVATVHENACSACGNIITPAEIQKIKSSIDEYYCQICKRILYHG